MGNRSGLLFNRLEVFGERSFNQFLQKKSLLTLVPHKNAFEMSDSNVNSPCIVLVKLLSPS